MGIPSGKLKRLGFKPVGISQQLYEILADAIIKGALRGGEQLVEDELRNEFGVSRSPIREALRELAKRGLVVIVPRKGTFVRKVTRKDLDELFPVRARLEGLAAREAHKRLSKSKLKAMQQVLHDMETAARDNEPTRFYEEHYRFHDIFINASRNQLLISMLATLRLQVRWYQHYFRYHAENFDRSLEIHERILQLLEDRDAKGEKIETLVRSHIEEGWKRVLDYLKEEGR